MTPEELAARRDTWREDEDPGDLWDVADALEAAWAERDRALDYGLLKQRDSWQEEARQAYVDRDYWRARAERAEAKLARVQALASCPCDSLYMVCRCTGITRKQIRAAIKEDQ